MSMDVYLDSGLQDGQNLLGIDPRKFARMEINAINRAGRRIKRVLIVEPLNAATHVRKQVLNERIRLRTATNKTPMATIVPSSRGIQARLYKHRAGTGSGSRARILVAWVKGEKVAAGFINPRSSRRMPLATRSERERKVKSAKRSRLSPDVKSYRYEWGPVPRNALGPSAAAMFAEHVSADVRSQAADILAEEFNAELDKVLF